MNKVNREFYDKHYRDDCYKLQKEINEFFIEVCQHYLESPDCDQEWLKEQIRLYNNPPRRYFTKY